MRIAVDFRMLNIGADLLWRGTGRYIQQQLREVLALDQANEYHLVYEAGVSADPIAEELRTAPNVRLSAITFSARDKASPEAYTATVDRWLRESRIDVLHATIPLVYTALRLSRITACPIVATLYDLIPLIYPDHFLRIHPHYEQSYHDHLQDFSAVDHLIAISESAAQDAVTYLDFASEQISVAYPICEPVFRVLDETALHDGLNPLKTRLKLPDHYIYSVIDMRYNKNVATLLAAYSMLPRVVRSAYPLVLGGYFKDNKWLFAKTLLDYFGVADEVLITGRVVDDELNVLYNAATVVVHSARYEGFGMTVLEAMRCGAPVVTTTSSSLPEVGGDAAVLVDPDDEGALMVALLDVLQSPNKRAIMRQAGLIHAQKFSPEQLGRQTLRVYQDAAADKGTERPAKIRAILSEGMATPLEQAHHAGEPVAGELRGRVVSAMNDWDAARGVLMTATQAVDQSVLVKVKRTLRRFRNLGLVWDVQRGFYQHLITWLAWLTERIATLAAISDQALIWHVTPDSIGLFVPPDPERFIDSAVLADSAARLRQLLQPGMTFIDAGAQTGYLSMVAALTMHSAAESDHPAGKTGKVIALESDSELFAVLNVNIGTLPDPHMVTMQQVDLAAITAWGTHHQVRLDHLLHNLTRIDVMHIHLSHMGKAQAIADIVNTLQAVLLKHHPTLILSVTNAVTPEPAWLRTWAESVGYHVVQSGTVYELTPDRTT